MNRTITVRRDYLHYIKKYNRYEKRHSMTSAHCSPCFIGLKEGDTVTIGQCRYLPRNRLPARRRDPVPECAPGASQTAVEDGPVQCAARG